MNIPKIAGFLGTIFVLFWIISAPTAASGSVSKIMTNTKSAGNSMVTFMENVLGGGTPTTGTARSGTTTSGATTSGTTTRGTGR